MLNSTVSQMPPVSVTCPLVSRDMCWHLEKKRSPERGKEPAAEGSNSRVCNGLDARRHGRVAA